MKILCFIDSLGAGGAQRQLVELAKGFKEKGNEVTFLTYHSIDFFKTELVEADIPLKTVIEPNYFKRIIKIRKTIRKEKPHAVLSFLEGANFMATLAGFPFRRWRLVVGERSANPKILKSGKLKLYRFFHLFTSFVVANSHKNMELVRRVNPILLKKKQKVIYNIINIPKLNQDSHTVIDKSKTSIIIAASYIHLKNLERLIEAISLLNEAEKSQLRIEWYGSSRNYLDYRERMQEKIETLNLKEVIHLYDATDRIFSKYMSADFIGLFSIFEGFPNTICEALALGKPVIVSKVSDLPLLLKDGENGFLCDAEDSYSIRDALVKAINTPQKEKEIMRLHNKELAEKYFNKEIIINDYLKLLS